MEPPDTWQCTAVWWPANCPTPKEVRVWLFAAHSNLCFLLVQKILGTSGHVCTTQNKFIACWENHLETLPSWDLEKIEIMQICNCFSWVTAFIDFSLVMLCHVLRTMRDSKIKITIFCTYMLKILYLFC